MGELDRQEGDVDGISTALWGEGSGERAGTTRLSGGTGDDLLAGCRAYTRDGGGEGDVDIGGCRTNNKGRHAKEGRGRKEFTSGGGPRKGDTGRGN